MPEFTRIGDKIVSRDRIVAVVDEALALRRSGLSQQETAARLGTDRTFISRLETLGEIRKGVSIAVVGVPVVNNDEILAVARERGVDFTFVLGEDERWSFMQGKSGLELFAEAADLLDKVAGNEVVIILGHNRPAQVMEALLARRSAIFHLSQIEGRPGCFSPGELTDLLAQLKGDS